MKSITKIDRTTAADHPPHLDRCINPDSHSRPFQKYTPMPSSKLLSVSLAASQTPKEFYKRDPLNNLLTFTIVGQPLLREVVDRSNGPIVHPQKPLNVQASCRQGEIQELVWNDVRGLLHILGPHKLKPTHHTSSQGSTFIGTVHGEFKENSDHLQAAENQIRNRIAALNVWDGGGSRTGAYLIRSESSSLLAELVPWVGARR
ncbi:hypothetical protein BC936DRAFT_140754 [Jimgerdemannia flammicorona]|uniref:Uncharacterized protein n=1 Tax=Jimgerdemannia flammicorona TaxID=994334 RepID=A0A433DGP0_9FUNG|nr:hypothetical protein BC936DRAFT_140754 [Jimgerdemannia flammicorona]